MATVNDRGDEVEVFDRGTALRPLRLIVKRRNDWSSGVTFANVGMGPTMAREIAAALVLGAERVEERERQERP